MPSLVQRVVSAFSFGAESEPVAIEAKAAPRGPLAKSLHVGTVQRADQPRRAVELLRRWADTNEWVRIAINRRKRQISQARWQIVRLDDPLRPADPRVVAELGKLFRFVNPKRESLRSFLDMVLEDVLVIDAGVIEKSKTVGGRISALYAVDGASIVPDPAWTGDDPRATRYRQYMNGKLTAEFGNSDMIYVMATPRSYNAIGWSPVETLARSIEADLYGDDFDYDMLRQTAPAGLIDVGALPTAEVEAFREYYESEIEGQRRVGIVGGAGVDASGNPVSRSASWIALQHSSREMERASYRTWLATKVAAAFELDLGVFNLTANLHKDTGAHQQSLTDEGHRSLGQLVEEYFTREIVWEIDENHGFRLADLNARDAHAQAELDKVYVALGVTTPNEIRLRDGVAEPVPWGGGPYIPGKGPWGGGSALGSKPDDEALIGPEELPAKDKQDTEASEAAGDFE